MNYELLDGIAVLNFDDGKANVIGHDFMDSMKDGLDRAEQAAKAVVISVVNPPMARPAAASALIVAPWTRRRRARRGARGAGGRAREGGDQPFFLARTWAVCFPEPMPIFFTRRRPRVGPPDLNWDLAMGEVSLQGG